MSWKNQAYWVAKEKALALYVWPGVTFMTELQGTQR